ncbi:DUF5666 domain-containing protein [Crossiella sp. SN42]|uniref:DUF5666 domain-containing protein n=1 Tax=Crossiella sp. SN42 TaxID=2944808 RepID=UPI00207D40BD|nr:DUF5666 domain-containing protein [Crossiella sp. SN42]MCO1580561.1 DUF5666 domain-containing protein [Crossiella sp. SN42]
MTSTPDSEQARSHPSKLTFGLAAAALATVAFAGGMWAATALADGSASAAPGQRGGVLLGPGGRTPTAGTVDRIEGDTLYLKGPNGSEVKVTLGADTAVQLSQPGKVGDIQPGATVTVQGERAADGSVTARQVTAQSAR